MTHASMARENAISFECKKDALQQRQSGDWKVSFTVQGLDMDERLTRAAMGTRFVAVLVEVNDDETPVPAKETAAKPRPIPQAGAKRMDWREVQPAAQAGIRCNDPVFWRFLHEEHHLASQTKDYAENAVRNICGVASRAELGANHKARVMWKQLDDQFQAWKALEHA